METLGVLSLDDDILFPCDALDEGFFLWTQNPQHMITYHPRRHVVSPWTRSWRYTFCRLNRQYSLGLTKTAFLHRDYLFYYTHYLPDTIRDHIDNTINCEDIAMSMFVFNVSNGLFPLVPEEWTVKSSVHLHSKQRGGLSSAGISHQNARSYCVDMFAQELKVKQTFSGYATFTLFRNETAMTWNNTTTTSATSSSSRFIKWQAKKKKWYQLSPKEFRDVVITQPRDELMEFAANSRNLGDSIEIEQDPYIYIIPGVVLHNVAPQVVAGVAVLGILCLLFRYRFLWDRL